MAKISNVRNDGKGWVTTGPKQVNSYNVSPSPITATPSPGTVVGIKLVDNFDYFQAQQTSAATDLIVLDTALPVGTEIQFYCLSACKVVPTSGDSNTINGGTNAQGITMAVGSVYQFNKTSATTWVCGATAASGSFSAPVPA